MSIPATEVEARWNAAAEPFTAAFLRAGDSIALLDEFADAAGRRG